MEINRLISLQKEFDEERQTSFAWSAPISAEDYTALTHNVLSLAGEVGELANDVKKFDRGDFSFSVLLDRMPSELADVLIYLFKICYQSGIDLEQAFLLKLEENKQRFPPGELSESSKVVMESFPGFDSLGHMKSTALAAAVEYWADKAASTSTGISTARLDDLGRKCRVDMPAVTRDKYVIAILVGVFAEGWAVPGRPEVLEALWQRIAPIAERYGYDRGQLAALTANGSAVTHEVLDVLEASASEVAKDEH